MPRTPSGKAPLKAIAVKLPPELHDAVQRYSDLHHIRISDLIREGLELRLHGPPPATGYTDLPVIPTSTAALLTRLADILATTADEVRQAVARTHGPDAPPRTPIATWGVPPVGGEAPQGLHTDPPPARPQTVAAEAEPLSITAIPDTTPTNTTGIRVI